MGDFKKVNVKIFGKKTLKSSPDTVYWKKLGVPVFLKEYGPIDYIDFSPIEPYYFSVTSSVRVQIYNPVTRQIHKNLGMFQKGAFGGSFRRDGRVLCAGGEECVVKLFDVTTKTLLRYFEGHKGPVHRCFFTADNYHIASFSDDETVNVWDIASETIVQTFNEHTDYVRAGAVSPVSPDIILSGGYDNYVKMYDRRSGIVVFSVNHGAPVESTLFLPSGGIFISAGGSDIKVWDAINGGHLLAKVHNHHKTVTCLCLATNGSRLMSGSLDRHVNVYDVATFQRLHTIDYPNAVLSVGISPNDETLAVGMVDGLVSVSRRETEVKLTKHERQKAVYKYATESKPKAVDLYVKNPVFEKQSKHDKLLRRREYTKALNAVLTNLMVNKYPHVTVSVIQELLTLKKFNVAISGKEDKTMVPLLKFLTKYMGDYRFTKVLVQAANVFLDIYDDSIADCSPNTVALFQRLSARLTEEIELTESLLAIEGCIDLLISASSAGNVASGVTPMAIKPFLTPRRTTHVVTA